MIPNMRIGTGGRCCRSIACSNCSEPASSANAARFISFWGSFDLAVTRFSGRRAPLHPGGVPHLSDAVVREAYSHEVSSAGFWPGGGGIDYAAFYSYAYPAPPGFAAASVQPEGAFFSEDLQEFILPYDAVRAADSPDAALLEFLQSTYDAAADGAHWDRAALECPLGQIDRPRAVSAPT